MHIRPSLTHHEASRGSSFHFPDLKAGLEAIRRCVQVGWTPPVVRLYDAIESGRQFGEWCPEERAFLLLLHEGPAARVPGESMRPSIASSKPRRFQNAASQREKPHTTSL